MGLYRNWYVPPRGNVWLDVVGDAPRPSRQRFRTTEEAEKAAAENAAALGPSVHYLGAFKRRPKIEPICETCNGYGCHPADGGAYPCPDCNPDKTSMEPK